MSGEHNASDKQTTVEEGTEFKGTLTSNCPVVVRGALDGDIKAPAMTVAETGTVVGNVEAKSIRSEGVLAGRVDADDIYLSGSVRSDTVIRAKTLEVKLKRDRGKLEVTFGDCILEVGDDPNAEAKKDAQAEAGKQGEKASKRPPEASIEAAGDDKRGDKKKKDQKPGKADDKSEEVANGKSHSIPPPA